MPRAPRGPENLDGISGRELQRMVVCDAHSYMARGGSTACAGPSTDFVPDAGRPAAAAMVDRCQASGASVLREAASAAKAVNLHTTSETHSPAVQIGLSPARGSQIVLWYGSKGPRRGEARRADFGPRREVRGQGARIAAHLRTLLHNDSAAPCPSDRCSNFLHANILPL